MGGPSCDRSGSSLLNFSLFHTWMRACSVPGFRMNFACWTGYLSVWRSPASFRLPDKNSPLTPLRSGPDRTAKKWQLPPRQVLIHVSVFLSSSSFSSIFHAFFYFFPLYSVPLYSRQDKLTRCANNDYKCGVFSLFFFFFTTAVCWFVGSTTFWPPPHPPPAQHLLFFPLLLVCVFLLVRGLSFGGCGVEDKSQWKWCWMKRRQETGLWGRAEGREKGGPL